MFQFDQIIELFVAEQQRIAAWTHKAQLSPLQRAASELVPSASSIALSIRELVRQAYLLSALILTRPLMERVATFSYLIENPSMVAQWEQGWRHMTRPTLKARTHAMRNVAGAPTPVGVRHAADQVDVASIIARYNSLVHGDPAAAASSVVLLDCGSLGFPTGKDTTSPDRADDMCLESACWLVVLLARCAQVFPDLPRPEIVSSP